MTGVLVNATYYLRTNLGESLSLTKISQKKYEEQQPVI